MEPSPSISSPEMVDIVDKDDVVVTTKPRDERTKDEILRTSALWLVDTQGNILLAKRKDTKKDSPGKRSVAVAETVQAGEEYLDALIRGAYEEIALSLTKDAVYEGEKMLSAYPVNNSFKQRYFAICPDEVKHDLNPDPDEVEEIRRFTHEEVAVLLNESPHLVSRSLSDIYHTRMDCKEKIKAELVKNLC